MSSSTPILTRFDRTARLAFLRSDWCRKPVVCIGALCGRKEHRASSTTSKEKHGFSSSSPDCAAARCRNSFIPAFYTCSKWRPQNLSGSSRSNDCNDHEPVGNLRSDARKAVPDPVRLSARRVAWRASDVLAWCESRTKTDASSAGGEA